jgi:PPOX class probable FMN-dependent enzyme
MDIISSQDQLDAIYNLALALASTAKELDHLIPEYRQYIEASPFVALATVGPEGLDCSPRGDAKGFVRVVDDKTLVMPDRRGNNRIDSLRNIVRDPRVALLFLIPGSGTTFRVNGKAVITADPELCASFEHEGKQPRSVIVVKIEAVYFQCARAIVRSSLWDSSKHVDPKTIPTPGQVLQRTTRSEIDAKTYDEEWPGRAAKSMW